VVVLITDGDWNNGGDPSGVVNELKGGNIKVVYAVQGITQGVDLKNIMGWRGRFLALCQNGA